MPRTEIYDLYENWNDDFDGCKSDHKHLFLLLEMGLINPHIASILSLSKVMKAQHHIESIQQIQGIFVCEPWRKTENSDILM